MAIELKNRMELDLQIRIPIVTFLQGPSITQFVNQVLTQLGGERATATVQAELVNVQANQAIIEQTPVGSVARSSTAATGTLNIEQHDATLLLEQLDQLSDQDVENLLNQMLVKEEEQREDNQPATSNEISSITPDKAEELLAHIDQLSDDEVDSLLSQLVKKEE